MNFNGYDLFHHIRNAQLRTYNRINTYLNIKERHGSAVGISYLKKFNKDEKASIFKMMLDMGNTGFEQYRRDFMRGRNA